MKPYLTTANGALYQRDCLEFMQSLKSETIDTIFADPPFNLGKDYKNPFNDRVSESEYLQWCRDWILEGCRILRPGGAFFLYAIPALAVKFSCVLEQRLQFRHWIALTMKGTFPRGRKLYPAHYALLYYTRGAPKTFNHVRLPIPTCRHCGGELRDYGGHRSKLNPKGISLTDFWDDTSPNRHKRFKVRPGVNELKLVIPERAILISTNTNDIVYDPFGGGGSTYQAAELSGRRWIGTELYDCHHIKQRLKETFALSVGQKPSFPLEELFNEDNDSQVLRRCERTDLPVGIVRAVS
jgi:site-specific DNA-methyltransferase (adenine-specific)